jgi:thiol-disulfide isomerase/thioredoxin
VITSMLLACGGGPTPAPEAPAEIPRVAELAVQASRGGCPRSVKPSDAILAQIRDEPLPVGWLAGAAGYRRAVGPDHGGKPAFVYFAASWCTYSQSVDKLLLATPEVKKALSKFTRVRIDPSAGADEDRLAAEWGVLAVPAFFVVQGESRRRVPALHEMDDQWVVLRPPDFVTAIRGAAE